MNKAEKSRPLVTQETGRMETAACGKAAISSVNNTTAQPRRQALCVTDILPHGRENALKMVDLREMLHADSRSIRARIQAERQFTPILSDCSSGYWISDDPVEARVFFHSMMNRSREIAKTAKAVARAAGLTQHEPQQLDGQGCIWAGGDSDG